MTRRWIGSVLSAAVIFGASAAQAKEIKVAVNGMVCGFCAQGITKKFKAQPEVEGIDVSLEKKLVKIDLKDSADLSDQKIKDLLKSAGYDVESITRSQGT